MLAFCSSCLGKVERRAVYSFLCDPCTSKLRVSPACFSQGATLYLYESFFRQLILQAKVTGDQRTLFGLVDLACAHPRLQAEAKQAEQVVAMPASFWGRWRGRLDIPWFLAQAVSRRWGLALRSAPFSLHWRLKKRAQQAGRQRLPLFFPSEKASIPTLLIDDIITTGFSLNCLARALPDARCRFLALADAYTHQAAKDSCGQGHGP